MNKRAPWALSLYFVFFLVLLVWGRLPEEPSACAKPALRLLNPATQLVIGEYQVDPFCPTCNGRSKDAATAPAPVLAAGGVPPDGKNSGLAIEPRDQRIAFSDRAESCVLVTTALLPDKQLSFLRTVVLLN